MVSGHVLIEVNIEEGTPSDGKLHPAAMLSMRG